MEKAKPSGGSWWEKAKGYAKAASHAADKKARKLQTRSASYDANRAANAVETVMTKVSATVTGLTKTTVASTIGGLKGAITGTAKGTQPLYVKALHAADGLASVGTWNEYQQYTAENFQTRHVVTVDINERVAAHYGIEDGQVDVTSAKRTTIELDGMQTEILARPIFEQGTSRLVGVFVFVIDEHSPAGKEILLYQDGFENL